VLVVGEALVDMATEPGPTDALLRLVAHPGGSPANVAVGLARLSVSTAFAGRISTTGFGPWLRAHLQTNGVDTALSVRAPENASLALVTLDGAGVPSYTFYVDGTSDWQWREPEFPDLPLRHVAAVHTGSLAAALEPGRAALEAWLAAVRADGDAFISFDPNVRPSLIKDLLLYREQLGQVVALAHLVKVSDQDLHELYPNEDPIAVANRWAASGPEMVIVTHGPDGATAVRAGREAKESDLKRGAALLVHRPAVPTAVVDTVGAGDAFMAGLLAWLVERQALAVGAMATLDAADLAAWLDFANRVAALTCGRAGADPPRRAEV
jgi:fructokinase